MRNLFILLFLIFTTSLYANENCSEEDKKVALYAVGGSCREVNWSVNLQFHNCREGNDNSCATLSVACHEGSGLACFLTGYVYYLGKGNIKVKKDLAFDYFTKSCKKGYDFGCNGDQLSEESLNTFKTNVIYKLFPNRFNTALYMTYKECKNETDKSCEKLVQLCEFEIGYACFYVAYGHYTGKGYKKSKDLAYKYNRKACENGVDFHCLGNQKASSVDFNKYFEKIRE